MLSAPVPVVMDQGPLNGTVTTKKEKVQGPSQPADLARALLADPLVTDVPLDARVSMWSEWLGINSHEVEDDYFKLCREHLPEGGGDRTFKEVM